MKQWKDPFPPTPERFSLRVERTLQSLEEIDMHRIHLRRKLIALAAAALAALLAAMAVAAINGNSSLKAKLQDEGAGEAAEMVQEPHAAAPGAEEGFAFSIDEILWEDANLYVSYSLSVPRDGKYLVAMYAPTLNGEKLEYDAKGFTLPKFFDLSGDAQYPAVLLLGGGHKTSCNELWTFRVSPALRERKDNHLKFRAVLLRTDANLPAAGDWTDLLDPPESFFFTKNWRAEVDAEALERFDEDAQAMLDAVEAAWDGAEALSLNALLDSGYAEYVDQRAVDMTLDATQMPQALYNDVAEHDFDVGGLHLHVDSFRMTHLGVSLRYTVSVPDAAAGDRAAIDRLNSFVDSCWRFGTVDGKPLGYSLGAYGGGGWSPLADGTPAYGMNWTESAVLSLDGLEQIAFAPVTWRDDAQGNPLPPEYDMDQAITLTPVCSEDVARAEAQTTPRPTRDPAEEGDLSK